MKNIEQNGLGTIRVNPFANPPLLSDTQLSKQYRGMSDVGQKKLLKDIPKISLNDSKIRQTVLIKSKKVDCEFIF